MTSLPSLGRVASNWQPWSFVHAGHFVSLSTCVVLQENICLQFSRSYGLYSMSRWYLRQSWKRHQNDWWSTFYKTPMRHRFMLNSWKTVTFKSPIIIWVVKVDVCTDTHVSRCWVNLIQRRRTHIVNGPERCPQTSSYRTYLSCRWTPRLCCEWRPNKPDSTYSARSRHHIPWYEKSRRTLPGLGVKGESEKTLSSRFFIKKQI